VKIEWPNQNAHMLLGVAVMFGFALYRPGWAKYAFGVLALWAILKELYDVLGEPEQDVLGAAIDAGFYFIGTTAAAVVLTLTGRI
jgi:hypothetical protein